METSAPGNDGMWGTLRGAAFDLDGVLVRTDHLHYRAWKELADELGIPFDEERNHRLRGVSREESLRRIYEGHRPLPPAPDFRAQCERKNARYVELVGHMKPADVLPGALALLSALRREGVRCAVASASKNCAVVLARTGLDAYLDAAVDGNHVSASKPDPQGFLLAARLLRAAPADCVGVEDAETGIEAIRRAGMCAVGIGAQAGRGDLVVESVAELSVEALRRAHAEWAAAAGRARPP